MATLTRTQMTYIDNMTTQKEQMAVELQTLKSNANQVPNSLQTNYDENVRRLEAAYLAIENNLNAWEQVDAAQWRQTQKQMNQYLQAYNQAMAEMLNMLRKSNETDSLGWIEGMAQNLQQRSQGWTEGVGKGEEGSEGWTEGMGQTKEDSEGWTEGMTNESTT